jgi:hypothetical protein
MKGDKRSLEIPAVCVRTRAALLGRCTDDDRGFSNVTTPDSVESRIGTLDFKGGLPGKDTLSRVYDNLDLAHAFDAFMNTFQGVNMREGNGIIGVKDNEIVVLSELMDAKSLFLTVNVDTAYFIG